MFGQPLKLVVEWSSHGKPSTVISAIAISLSQWEISESKLLELTGLMDPLPCTSPTLQGSRVCSATIIIPLSQVAVVVFRKPSTLTRYSSWISPCQPSEDFRKNWFHYQSNFVS